MSVALQNCERTLRRHRNHFCHHPSSSEQCCQRRLVPVLAPHPLTGTLFNISMLSLSERSSNHFSDLSSRNGCASRAAALLYLISCGLVGGKPEDRSAAKPRLAIMVKSHSRLHFFFPFLLSIYYLWCVVAFYVSFLERELGTWINKTFFFFLIYRDSVSLRSPG